MFSIIRSNEREIHYTYCFTFDFVELIIFRSIDIWRVISRVIQYNTSRLWQMNAFCHRFSVCTWKPLSFTIWNTYQWKRTRRAVAIDYLSAAQIFLQSINVHSSLFVFLILKVLITFQVFLKQHAFETLQALSKQRLAFVTVLQSAARGFLARRRVAEMMRARREAEARRLAEAKRQAELDTISRNQRAKLSSVRGSSVDYASKKPPVWESFEDPELVCILVC
jgi:hypothetical protein